MVFPLYPAHAKPVKLRVKSLSSNFKFQTPSLTFAAQIYTSL